MGNESYSEKVNHLENENISINNIKKEYSNSNKKQSTNLNLNNNDKYISTLIEQIESINGNLTTLNEKIKSNFIGFSMSKDFILDETSKFEITNDIKNKFISPILDSLKNKDKEILDLKVINENLKAEIKNLNNQYLINNKQLKDDILNEITLLKKQFENNKGNLENLISINSNKIVDSKNSINSDLDKIKKNYDFKIMNLNKQFEENNSDFQTFKKKAIKENENLEKKISKERENLTKLIDEKEKLEKLIKKHDSDIEKIKKDIANSILENDNLKKVNTIQNNELKTLNQKIEKNVKQIEKLKEDIEQIDKNFRVNTIKIFKESILKFSAVLTDNYILNKQKRQHELKLKLYSNKKYATVGLDNIGNNCYLNSVLQILKNIPKFTYNISQFNDKSDKFLLELRNLMINICDSNYSSFSPLDFKTILGIENSKFAGNNQYDSTIFYISLLNIIHKKINKAKKDKNKKLNTSKLIDYIDKSLEEKFEIWKENFLLKNQSFIFDLFYIFYANEIECNFCHKRTHTIQTSNFLDFPIASGNNLVKTLEECFDNYLMVKNFTDNCSKCNKNKLSQKFIILELPPVLMINLKRVGENTAYLNEIDIPFRLDMKKIIKNFKKNIAYELRGFIKHSGNEKGGHNYSFCKNMFDDTWYEYNDNICSPIENLPKLNKIFFLCYIQIGSDIGSVEYLKQIIEALNTKNSNFFNK